MKQFLEQLAFKLRVVRHFVHVRWLARYRNLAALRAAQAVGLRKHMRFLKQHSPYIAEQLGNPSTHVPAIFPGDTRADTEIRAHLELLPAMDKTSMMEHFNTLNTAGLDKDTALSIAIRSEKDRDFSADYNGISVGLSSGTSGHRGLFVVSPRERAQWAGTILALTLPPRKILGHKIALFLRAGNQLYDSLGSKAVHFEYFDIYRPLVENLQALNALQPTILVAPPSVLRHIAEAQTHGTITIAPQKIFTAAEVLEPIDENYFKQVFGHQHIHQIYQCTEGLLGVTCEHGTMHLNEQAAIFEKQYVSQHRFTPIVTDYQRTTQPIVRYRLSDLLVEKQEKCACGNPATAIERIEGRVGDTLELTDTHGTRATIYADMISRAMVYADGVAEYRVIQRGPHALDIQLKTQPHTTDADCQRNVRTELAELFARFELDNPTLTFQPYTHEPGAKLRRVEKTQWT